MQLSPNLPIGHPALQLSEEEVSTVVDLICRGVEAARTAVKTGMLEVPLTLLVRKSMRRAKHELGLTNLEVRGEHELDEMHTDAPIVPGRIDISLKFLHQFGFEDAYVAVECKRVGYQKYDLNKKYVAAGVARFASGQYAAGHNWGMMLGYTIALPWEPVASSIDRRLRALYGSDGGLVQQVPPTMRTLATFVSSVQQGTSSHKIRLMHIFVDLRAAAKRTRKRKAS